MISSADSGPASCPFGKSAITEGTRILGTAPRGNQPEPARPADRCRRGGATPDRRVQEVGPADRVRRRTRTREPLPLDEAGGCGRRFRPRAAHPLEELRIAQTQGTSHGAGPMPLSESSGRLPGLGRESGPPRKGMAPFEALSLEDQEIGHAKLRGSRHRPSACARRRRSVPHACHRDTEQRVIP